MAEAGLWVPELTASVSPGPHKSAERDLNGESAAIETRQSEVQDCIFIPSAADCVKELGAFALTVKLSIANLLYSQCETWGTGLAPTEMNIISIIMSSVR